MRLLAPLLLPALAISLLATPAAAADLTATSEIEAVTVFSSGALVTRKLTRDIPAGNHTLIINDLPAGAVHSSIRVEGSADGDLQIGAVDIKRVSVTSDEAAARDAERKRLEDELEKLTDAMDSLRADIEVKETQKTLITNLAGLPQQPPSPAGTGGQPQDWSKLLDLIGSGMTDLQSTILKARIAMRELGRDIEDIKKKLAEQAPKQESRTELRIALQAAADLNADLKLRYQVSGASWAPLYEARLTAGTDAKEPELALTRRASITQQTGEAWQGVALTLSTARPSANTSAPTVWPLTVDFYTPPQVKPMSGQLSMRSGGGRAKGLAEFEADRRVQRYRSDQLAAAPRAVAQTQATVERTAFEASFTVPGRVDVANTGEAKRVELSKETLKPKLEVRTVPRQASIAYLYANLTLPNDAPYLAGQIALFRDNTFVGNGRLPNLAPGAEHQLGFGRDQAVTVKYDVLGEKRGESGIISSSTTDQRNYRITVTNQHPRPIEVLVIDQMPVSLNEDITVELTGPNAPDKKNFEDKRGVLAWRFDLKPAAERKVTFGYQLSWPADKKITYRQSRQ